MKITDVDAVWLSCPIPYERQHVSDFGRLESFDMALVKVTTDTGIFGYGEAKAAVGSAGSCAAIVHAIREELKPLIVGEDARQINRLWQRMYNGSRTGYGEARGRSFPILGRRGHMISAISGIDMALWDALGQSLGVPLVQLLGGACRDRMPAYASGGWADVDGIGEQLSGYVAKGFGGVKMRIGVMDGSVAASVARVRAARDAIGPDVMLMVDAHGTMNTPEAKQFCRETADLNLRWFEEPVSADNRQGLEEVRQMATMPIANGESEFTVFDFNDLVQRRAADVLQPDLAICGGVSEAVKIGALATANQLELAPHCWGSAYSFTAGLSVAFSCPAAVVIEFSLGHNPMMFDLVAEEITTDDGYMTPPDRPGLGLTPNPDFVKEFGVN